jgi:CheY-like chemotaxis protein
MKNFKILIVDDEPRMRKIIKDFLNIHGYEILEAENGQKALELFETLKYTKTEIAHLCGFYDYSHMERGLKRYSINKDSFVIDF